MGRKKVPVEDKRKNLTININRELFEGFKKLKIKKKSRFFDAILNEYFNNKKENI